MWQHPGERDEGVMEHGHEMGKGVEQRGLIHFRRGILSCVKHSQWRIEAVGAQDGDLCV